jgi:hypothetical protein
VKDTPVQRRIRPQPGSPGFSASALNSRSETAVKTSASQPGSSPPSLADLALDPSVNASMVAVEFLSTPGGALGVTELLRTMRASVEGLKTSGLDGAEAMLYAQAHALQAIFVEMARRAAKQDRLDHRETCLRMALKAQNQCRMTLETLATVKSPPVVIARQANIANGPQQVNNGPAASDAATPRARTRRKSRPNELRAPT